MLYSNLTKKRNRDLMAAGSNRIAKGVVAGGSAVAKATARAANVLFLEVMGLIFVVMGVGFAGRAIGEYIQHLRSHTPQHKDVVVLAVLAIMFLYFGITSFWRARRK